MLPKFEVIIPEVDSDVSQDSAIEVVQDPGIYVLQAGSFSSLADADRRRAELALLGIESVVQRIAIDDKTYHRVRIGPIENLDRLNLIRNQLRQAGIDVLRIRLGD
jgi:cell division protein FtsN